MFPCHKSSNDKMQMEDVKLLFGWCKVALFSRGCIDLLGTVFICSSKNAGDGSS